MGARVYVPSLGRFLQVDPVEGGTQNNYTYPSDPINSSDYSGTFAFAIPIVVIAIPWAQAAASVAAAAVGAAIGYIAFTAAKHIINQASKSGSGSKSGSSSSPSPSGGGGGGGSSSTGSFFQ